MLFMFMTRAWVNIFPAYALLFIEILSTSVLAQPLHEEVEIRRDI